MDTFCGWPIAHPRGKDHPAEASTRLRSMVARHGEMPGQLIEEEELREQIRVPESVHSAHAEAEDHQISWFGSANLNLNKKTQVLKTGRSGWGK